MELTELGKVAERDDLVGEKKLQSIFFVATDFLAILMKRNFSSVPSFIHLSRFFKN